MIIKNPKGDFRLRALRYGGQACEEGSGGLVRRSVCLRTQREGGATMLEAMIGLPLFLFLILCMFSILWASYQMVVAQYLATEAVRELVVLREAETGGAGRGGCIVRALTGQGVGGCPSRLERLNAKNYAVNLNADSIGITVIGDEALSDVYKLKVIKKVVNTGHSGDFVLVWIQIDSILYRIISGDIINLGGDLQYNQNFGLTASAVGRNEPCVDM